MFKNWRRNCTSNTSRNLITKVHDFHDLAQVSFSTHCNFLSRSSSLEAKATSKDYIFELILANSKIQNIGGIKNVCIQCPGPEEHYIILCSVIWPVIQSNFQAQPSQGRFGALLSDITQMEPDNGSILHLL